MVQEAEDAADEDREAKQRVEARNQLENYAYQVRNTLNDKEKGLADKIEEDDKESLETALKAALDWLEENPSADKDEYDAQYKELEQVVQPIFSKFYKSGGGAPGGGDDEEMPSHDEL